MDANSSKKQPSLPLLNLSDQQPISSDFDPFLTFSPTSLSQILIDTHSRRKSSFTIKPKDDEKCFSLDDDLLIFRTIRLFYGSNFDGKINILFWQVFKRSTGSLYTTAELSHHWSYLVKKYDTKIKTIDDCISEVKEKLHNSKTQSTATQRKNRIVRSKSYESITIQVNRSTNIFKQNYPKVSQAIHVNTARPKDTNKLLSNESTNNNASVPIST